MELGTSLRNIAICVKASRALGYGDRVEGPACIIAVLREAGITTEERFRIGYAPR